MELNAKAKEQFKYNVLREDIVKIDRKIDRAQDRVEGTNRRLDGVPRRLNNMEDGYREINNEYDTLRRKQEIHELKLQALEQEVGYVRKGNELILDHIRSPRDGRPDDSPRNGRPDGDGLGQGRYGNDTYRSMDYGERDQRMTQNGRGYGQDSSRDPGPAPRSPAKEGADRRTLNTAERNEKEEDMRWEKRKQVYSRYDQTSINPHNHEKKSKHKQYPYFDHEEMTAKPGGFMFLKCDDSALEAVKVVLRSPQQSIHRHAGGYNLGVARKDKLIVLEDPGSANRCWGYCRDQKFKDVLCTEDCVFVYWFTSPESANHFFENSHRGNPFREPCWPTSNGYDAIPYLPMNRPPPAKRTCRAFLVMEFRNARYYSPEDMTQFESEVRSYMNDESPGCLPLVVSSLYGNTLYKPGSWVCAGSKVYVSQFESMADVERVWMKGKIQELRFKHRMGGPIHVFAFYIDDLL